MQTPPIIFAFIDSQNLNLAIKDCGWELDFRRFRILLKEKYGVSKAFLFLGYLPSNKPLYDYLRKSDFILIFKPILDSREGFIKGNCDAELVLHTMIQYPSFDHAIIVSGDGDFYCLAEYLMENKKLIHLGIPNKYRYSALLRKFSSFHFYINRLQHLLGHKK